MSFSEVRIDPTDRGFLTGDAVFDAARTFSGVGFRLEEHTQRLFRSLHVAQIDPGLSADTMNELTEEVIRRNVEHLTELGDFQVWQGVTRGPGRWAHQAGPPTVYLKVSGVDFGRYARLYATGAHAVTTGVQSLPHASVDPKLKTHSRMHFNLAEIAASGVDPEGWPVLVDAEGNLTEGSGYNLCIVRRGSVLTPASGGVLTGVSRDFVLELCARLGIEARQTQIQPYDLYTADEAFFTATSPCVLPVTRADKRLVGDGKPGPITAKLLEAWGDTVGLDIVEQALKYV